MKRKSIKKNYIYNLSYQILALIVPLITTPYVSRVLGVDGVGTYGYTFSNVTYFTLLATMGTNSFGQREISYFQNDKRKYSNIFWSTEALSCLCTLFSFALYIIFATFFFSNKRIYYILSLNIVAVAFDISWFFQGLEEFKVISIRNFIFKVLNVAFIFIFVKQKSDLNIYIFGLSFFTLLSAISMWTLLPKYVVAPKFNNIHPLIYLKGSFALFIPSLATSIYTVLDKTMIGLITKSSYENGYYEQAIKIPKIALTIISALGTVIIPRIGYYFENGRKDELKTYIYKSFSFVWFLGCPLCFGLIGISANFVPWFFGPGYEQVTYLLYILSFLIIIIGLSTISGSGYLIPTKREKYFTLTLLCGSAVNFVLNSIFIRINGAFGAAVASVISEAVIVILQFYIIHKEISISKILKNSIKYIIASIILLFAIIPIRTMHVGGFAQTIIEIIVGILTYSLCLIIMKDYFINNIFNLLKNTARRKSE